MRVPARICKMTSQGLRPNEGTARASSRSTACGERTGSFWIGISRSSSWGILQLFRYLIYDLPRLHVTVHFVIDSRNLEKAVFERAPTPGRVGCAAEGDFFQ